MKVLIAVLSTLLLPVFFACSQKEKSADEQGKESIAIEEQQTALPDSIAIDPICEMQVSKSSAQFTADHDGETYYFCIEQHKVDFEQDPQKYLAKNE